MYNKQCGEKERHEGYYQGCQCKGERRLNIRVMSLRPGRKYLGCQTNNRFICVLVQVMIQNYSFIFIDDT